MKSNLRGTQQIEVIHMVARRVLSDAQVAEAVELFKAGFDSMKIAAHFGVSDATVRNWLKRSGIVETDSRIKMTPEQIEEAKVLYAGGQSTIALARKYNTTQQTVATALQKAGVTLRPRGAYRTCTLREDAFDVPTPEVCYWAGWLATDGCVSGDAGRSDWISLNLNMDDALHVEKFRSFLGSNHKVGFTVEKHPTDPKRECGRCGVTIRSRHLVDAVAKYGITRNKTFTIIAKGGVENSRDYWRGCVEGDGTLGVYPVRDLWECTLKLISMSQPFLVQFRDFLKGNGVRGDFDVFTEKHPNAMATAPLYILRLGVRAALDAVSLLYTDAAVTLARKEAIAKTMIQYGVAGKLLGTVRESWYNANAAAWAGVVAH